ncbi:hypothetical protein ZWY2020_001533 [Hordeum vulgare]|nr:hypothetical protein ZWY2020_001533 [Hordeum vulgare]
MRRRLEQRRAHADGLAIARRRATGGVDRQKEQMQAQIKRVLPLSMALAASTGKSVLTAFSSPHEIDRNALDIVVGCVRSDSLSEMHLKKIGGGNPLIPSFLAGCSSPARGERGEMGSVVLTTLRRKREVDAAIRDTLGKVLVLRFGCASHSACLQLNDFVST